MSPVELYESGLSIKQVAAITNLPWSTVRNILAKAKVLKLRKTAPKYLPTTKEIYQKAQELRENRKEPLTVARQLRDENLQAPIRARVQQYSEIYHNGMPVFRCR